MALEGGSVEVVDVVPPDNLAASVVFVNTQAGVFSSHCSGTLIDRDLVVTAAKCLQMASGGGYVVVPPGTVKVSFSFGDTEYAVNSIDVLPLLDDPLGIAMLRLVDEVPTSIVEEPPVVYLGDVGEILADTEFADPIVLGFGCPSGDPFCAPLRQRGKLTRPEYLKARPHHIQAHHSVLDIRVSPYPAESPMFSGSDLGGPLFMFDTRSSRWVLAGVLSDILTSNGHFIVPVWNYLGVWTGSAPGDHASIVRPYLGPDDDGDGVPDRFDNCPPSECVAANLDPQMCANGDQVSSLGGTGDACAFADPRLQFGRNSNVEIEIDLAVLSIPDLFDPVPLMRIESHPHVPEESDWATFQAAPWLGKLSDVDRARGYTHDVGFEERIGFRFCECIDELTGFLSWKRSVLGVAHAFPKRLSRRSLAHPSGRSRFLITSLATGSTTVRRCQS